MRPGDLSSLAVLVELGAKQAHIADQQGRESPVDGSRGEGRHREGLNLLVERRVVVLELLIVRQVAGPRPIEDDADQPWCVTANAAGGLDVFGGGFRLARHDHQPETFDIHADRNHIRRQQHIKRPG